MQNKMIQFYITPYENGYCFVHDSGRPDKFIFSREKAMLIHLKEAKLTRIDGNYFEYVKKDGTVEHISYKYINPEQIVGTMYRIDGKIEEHQVHIPLH
jgi:hypothetical protein